MSVCRGTAKEVTIIFQIGVHIGKLKERKPKFGQQTLEGRVSLFLINELTVALLVRFMSKRLISITFPPYIMHNNGKNKK